VFLQRYQCTHALQSPRLLEAAYEVHLLDISVNGRDTTHRSQTILERNPVQPDPNLSDPWMNPTRIQLWKHNDRFSTAVCRLLA